MARRKSAKEKMLTLKEPKVVEDPRGRGKMLIPTPLLLAGLIRRIPRGSLPPSPSFGRNLQETLRRISPVP